MYCKDCVHGAPYFKGIEFRYCELVDHVVDQDYSCNDYQPIDI